MNEYKVTWELYCSWAIENMFKGARLALMIIWSVLTLVCLVLGIFVGGGLRIFYFAMMLFALYHAFFRVLVLSRSQYRRLSKAYGSENWIRRITFEEDGISLAEGNFSYKYNYGDIKTIREEGGKIWLMAANGTVLRLYKEAFVDSNWEECKAKIEEMQAKEAEQV